MIPNAKNNGFPHTTTNTDLVFEYFRLISEGNIHNLLNLFTEDCVIYEPFSKLEAGLKGKSAVEPFLHVAMMATSGMRHEIEIKFQRPVELDIFSKNGITTNVDGHVSRGQYGRVIIVSALVTFHRGDKVRGRFNFEIVSNYDDNDDYNGLGKTIKSKIKRLDIQFIE